MPKRIQLSRAKGWRKPAGAVLVSRPSVFGNPFLVKAAIELGFSPHYAPQACVDSFRAWLRGSSRDWMGPEADAARAAMLARLAELRGRDLCCWCPLDQPCHADVLLEIANA